MTPATHARPGRNTLVDSFYRLASANAAAHSPSQKTEPVAAPVLLRKLPVVPPPVHYETVESYLGRLEKGNQLRNHDLINGFQRKKDWVDHLANFTGRTKERLALALPEVADALHGSPPAFGRAAHTPTPQPALLPPVRGVKGCHYSRQFLASCGLPGVATEYAGKGPRPGVVPGQGRDRRRTGR